MSTRRSRPPSTTPQAEAEGTDSEVSAPSTEVDEASDRPGRVLRGYRLAVHSIEDIGIAVGGNTIEALGVIGLPDRPTQALRRAHASSLTAVCDWSDRVGTKAGEGAGAGVRAARSGVRTGAKAWVRGMRFFVTLR
jgi:hypothetical protein